MIALLRKYGWTLNLLTIGLCALFLARGVGQVVMAQVPPARPAPAAAGARAVIAGVTAGARNVQPILDRNIFCSTCEPVTEADGEGGEPGEDGAPGPTRSSADLQLIATLVSSEDQAWSYAAIRDATEDRTGLFNIGSAVPGGATVFGIESRRVILQRGASTEYLELGGAGEQAEAPKPRVTRSSTLKQPKATDQMKEFADGIRKVGPTKWEIDRGVLNKALTNTTLIARSARIVPSVKDGKPNGFKLYGMRPGSFYSLLGMFNGDTIHAVNGHPINTPDKALEIYTKLRSASHVTLSYSRRGQEITHEYVVR